MMGDGFEYSAMGYNANGIFWILLIILFIWLYSVLTAKTKTPEPGQKDYNNKLKNNVSSPVEILEKRLAEGKIDIKEFNRRLAHMKKDSSKEK